jgi:glycosyltransferase involved in cell wall biosynthesis
MNAMSTPVAAPRPPPVTVLMGVFNGLPHLERAIVSIQQQTLADFEFLVIDDGSTDGSGALLERLASDDRRLRIISHARNRGLGAVLNDGVAAARGALVARMDADDISLPTRLERQVEFFRLHPETDVVGSYALDVDAAGREVRERRVPTSHDRIVELVWSNPFIHTTVMFRREAVLRAGSYAAHLQRRQDYDLWFRCVRAGLRLANIPESLVRYHYSDETMRRNTVSATFDQVRIGLRGCRLVRAPLHAYAGTCLPLLEAALPPSLRSRFIALKSRIDPRTARPT